MKRIVCLTITTGLLLVVMLGFGTGCPNNAATYNADLIGADETPPVSTSLTAHLEITFNAARTEAKYTLTVNGGVGVISSELHMGAINNSGPRVAILFENPAGIDINGTLASDTLTDDSWLGDLTSLAELENAIKQGNVYCNIHTLANPNGAIRGQLQ